MADELDIEPRRRRAGRVPGPTPGTGEAIRCADCARSGQPRHRPRPGRPDADPGRGGGRLPGRRAAGQGDGPPRLPAHRRPRPGLGLRGEQDRLDAGLRGRRRRGREPRQPGRDAVPQRRQRRPEHDRAHLRLRRLHRGAAESGPRPGAVHGRGHGGLDRHARHRRRARVGQRLYLGHRQQQRHQGLRHPLGRRLGGGSDLAVWPAADYTPANRSHFDSRDYWFAGALQKMATGWLGRWLDLYGSADNPLQAVSIDSSRSRSARRRRRSAPSAASTGSSSASTASRPTSSTPPSRWRPSRPSPRGRATTGSPAPARPIPGRSRCPARCARSRAPPSRPATRSPTPLASSSPRSCSRRTSG